MSDSNKKNILVTGCTSGIGLEVSKYLHELDYGLLLVGRDEEKIESISKQLDSASYFICDLRNSGQIKDIFSFCQESGIMLDGMVHCAGCGKSMPVRCIQEEEVKEPMQVHYYAFLELCKYFYNRKISYDGSSIIAVSSIGSMTKRKGSVAYVASKNALNTAVSIASKEFLKRRIRVNAIQPAYVDTRMTEGLESLVNIKKQQPMGLIPPRDIAYIIEFLLSEKSKFITGAFIPISAGMEV